MAVRVQSREDTVRDAIQGEIIRGECAPLKALEANSGFINLSTELHDALWDKVQGDEACQGPVYNYARILTYPKLRNRIVGAFEEKLASQHTQEARLDSSEPVQEPQSLPSMLEDDSGRRIPRLRI
jgi:hypothetical protein